MTPCVSGTNLTKNFPVQMNSKYIYRIRKLSILSRIIIGECRVRSVLLRGCETWILLKMEKDRIETFEIMWRNMKGIK